MFEPKAQPTINFDKLRSTLTAQEFELVQGIVANKGKNAGRLRASKPPVLETDYVLIKVNEQTIKVSQSGTTAYIWRMVAFEASGVPAHHCMPITADWDLNTDDHNLRRSMAQYLDIVTEKVLETIPSNEHWGLIRWSRALRRL